MQTIFHAYRFNLKDAKQKAQWHALQTKLKSLGLHCFETWGGNSHHYKPELDGTAIELETKHLFANQWNTAPIPGVSDLGLRIFDWAKDSNVPGWCADNIAQGHWIEQTDEMREIRRNTIACGYCGRQEPAAKGYVFCPHCLDSEYLKASDLFLLRMLPVEIHNPERAPLSEAERGYLLPLYREAQIHGNSERGIQRKAKQCQDAIAECAKTIKDATIKRDATLWMLDRGLSVDNMIYYSHTGRFYFGWREPLSAEVANELLDHLCEFPFEYDLKKVP